MNTFDFTQYRLYALLSMIMLFMLGCTSAKQTKDLSSHLITSPDQKIQVSLNWGKSQSPVYSITFDGQALISASNLDLIAADSSGNHSLVFESSRDVEETTPLPWGQFSDLHSHYREATFRLVDQTTATTISVVEFRVFNEAVAFRHVFKQEQGSANGSYSEKSEFNFATDYEVWSHQGEKDPKLIPALSTNTGDKLRLPVILTKTGQPTVAIQEAALTESGQMMVNVKANSQLLSVHSDDISPQDISSTAWRVVQIAKQHGDLITSQVLLALSPENQIEDTSWIRTGKSFWDWRVRGATYGDHVYALDNESLERMIDFAAEHGMQHVMIDANWYGPEHEPTSSPYTEIEGLHIRRLINEANSRGVGFILYLNDAASQQHDLDKLFETWASWGAAGVKYGFMRKQGKEKVEKTLKIVALAAKHKLLINFHDGPIAPSGLRRTWPNWVTREYVHAQTDGGKTYKPSGFIQMAHVNALTGPLDMSNGFFQLEGLVESRKYVRQEVYSTVASEVARSLIIFSGLIIFPDSPEAYLGKLDLYEFLHHMPATWDESHVLDSDINSHIITARRTGDEWFVGAVVNEQGGDFSLDLDFLADNQAYQAKIFADKADTHYQTNREAYQIMTKTVKKGDKLQMQLAPGGGQAIWFKPLNK